MPLIFVVNKRHYFRATDKRRPVTYSRVRRVPEGEKLAGEEGRGHAKER
jgi:hypothetical protein